MPSQNLDRSERFLVRVRESRGLSRAQLLNARTWLKFPFSFPDLSISSENVTITVENVEEKEKEEQLTENQDEKPKD